MKIALLGTGFGQAHAEDYAQRPDIDEVVVFGRSPDAWRSLSAAASMISWASARLSAMGSSVSTCLPASAP